MRTAVGRRPWIDDLIDAGDVKDAIYLFTDARRSAA